MKNNVTFWLVVFIFSITACADSAVQNNNSTIVDSDSEKITDAADEKLQKQIAQIAAAVQGKVGVKAVLLEDGKTISLNEKERFPMQSVYKFPIAMAALRQVDEGKLKLDQKIQVKPSDFVRQGMRSPLRDENPNGAKITIEQLLKLAVSESDGTASDVLFDLIGGGKGMEKYFTEIGVKEIVAANSEKEIGADWETQYRNYASPEATIELLHAFYEQRGISKQNQELLQKMMIETPTGLKRLKGLLPDKTIVAHKTGTSGARRGITAATNDIGIITLPNGKHLAIAVFVSDSPADEKTREETIAKIAKAVWDEWNK